MNLIFVRICNLGVSGVAIATSISNVLSSIFIIAILMNENSDIKFHINKLYLNFDALYKILRIGIPCAIQRILLSASNLCVQSLLNSLGADTIAGNATALNLEYYSLYVLTAFGHACSTFLSENYSAKKIDRCKKIYLYCLIYGCLSSLIIVSIFQIFSKNLITLFSTDQNVINIAMIRIKLVGSLIWIQTFSEVCGAAIRALRHPHLPSIITITFSVAL